LFAYNKILIFAFRNKNIEGFMANKINMYYRFTSDTEPKEEQLSHLMQEVRKE